ncbi:MAG: DMT family transporter [Clostridia bacterium]|nr:DMT family transporter [Clostridia bacterium]
MKETKQNIFTNPIIMSLFALLCCALWGSATPAIKTASALLIPESGVPSTILFAGIRFTMAGILTIAIYSIARKKLLTFKLENLPRVLTVSAFQTVIQYIFFYVGLTYTTGVKGTIASGSSAFFCVLIASLIFKQEKLTAKKIIACILGLCGIVIINLRGLELTMNFLGDGFVILSTVAYAFSSVFMKRFSKHEDPVVISGYQFIFGGAFLTLLGIVLGGRLSFESAKGVAILIYLAFLSAVAYALWGVLLKNNPVSKVSVFTFTTPIFGTVLSLLLLPEASGVDPINIIITLVLVSGGILLLNYSPREREKK